MWLYQACLWFLTVDFPDGMVYDSSLVMLSSHMHTHDLSWKDFYDDFDKFYWFLDDRN